MSATLLQMVNRFRRKLKWEDVSSFSSGDDLTTAAIDFINEAKRDVLENYEWDFDLRNAAFSTIAPLEYASAVGQVVITNGAATVLVPGVNNYATITGGNSRSRLAVTTDAAFGTTYFNILTGQHPSASDSYVIEMPWPGTSRSLFDASALTILTAEYVLPATVRDVLSVTLEEADVHVDFVDKAETLDRVVPNAFQSTSSVPEVCFVGGNALPTVTFGTTQVPGVGVWLYPVPSEVYLVRYTYRYRHPAISAIADVLYVPDHVVDLVVDLAVARAMRTRVAPDLEASQQLEAATMQRLGRSVRRTGFQPLERMSLKSHDRRGGGIPSSGGPRNPRIFYTP